MDNRPSIILRDFSHRVNREDKDGDRDGRRLLETFNDYFLTQRKETIRGYSVLNLVFITEINIVIDLCVEERLGGTDHKLIRFLVSYPDPRES